MPNLDKEDVDMNIDTNGLGGFKSESSFPYNSPSNASLRKKVSLGTLKGELVR